MQVGANKKITNVSYQNMKPHTLIKEHSPTNMYKDSPDKSKYSMASPCYCRQTKHCINKQLLNLPWHIV